MDYEREHQRNEATLLEAIAMEDLHRARPEDEFIRAHVTKYARDIGCNESNVTAAVAWAVQMPTRIAIAEGQRRARKLREKQTPFTPAAA